PPFDVSNPQGPRLRTFSNAYGLAGLRVGYGIGEAGLIRPFDKIRNHFGVNRMAQVGALAALADQPYLGRVIGQIAQSRERIGAIVRANGLEALPSATNFVAVDCDGEGAFAKRRLAEVVGPGSFERRPAGAASHRRI